MGSDYSVPVAPIAPVTTNGYGVPIAPLETIDLPEQGSGFLLPPQSREALQPTTSNSDYSVPVAPVPPVYTYRYGRPIAPVPPVKPIAPFKPIAPLETIDLPEEGSGFVLPPASRSGSDISTSESDFSVSVAPVRYIAPAFPSSRFGLKPIASN